MFGKGENISLQKIKLNHDIILGEKELEVEEVWEFGRPILDVEHALYLYTADRLVLKSKDDIVLVGKEALEFEDGLSFVSQLSFDMASRSIQVVGEKDGLRQLVKITPAVELLAAENWPGLEGISC